MIHPVRASVTLIQIHTHPFRGSVNRIQIQIHSVQSLVIQSQIQSHRQNGVTPIVCGWCQRDRQNVIMMTRKLTYSTLT